MGIRWVCSGMHGTENGMSRNIGIYHIHSGVTYMTISMRNIPGIHMDGIRDSKLKLIWGMTSETFTYVKDKRQ